MSYYDDDILPRWKVVSDKYHDAFAFNNLWNDCVARNKLPFRFFHVGSRSSVASRTRWMHWYLLKNRKAFDAPDGVDSEWIYDNRFCDALMKATHRIGEMGLEQAEEALQRQYNERLTPWKFIDPPHAMLWLAGMSETPPAEAQRRKEKARILGEFDKDLKDFRRRAVIISGSGPDSNKNLAQALELARQAMMQAEDDLRWLKQ